MTGDEELRTCIRCGLKKPLHDYHKDKKMRGGYKTLCRACKVVDEQERRRNIVHDFVAEKICNGCGLLLDRSRFQRDNSKRDALKNTCKECIRNPSSQRYLQPRYALQPLMRVMGFPEGLGSKHPEVSDAALGVRLGVTHDVVQQYRKRGLSWVQADELACRVGLHPVLVWPQWGDVKVAC